MIIEENPVGCGLSLSTIQVMVRQEFAVVHLTNVVAGQVAHHLTDKGRAQG